MYISVRVSDALGITIGDRIAFSENPFRLYRPGNLSSVKSCKIGATRCISLHVLTPRDEMLGKWSYEIENETVYLLERSI
jgi:hypothetical protein